VIDTWLLATTEVRLGVESLYSIAGFSIPRPRPCAITMFSSPCEMHTDFESESLEYIRRDLLNLALGIADNHGRNMAVLRISTGAWRLAPLYDFDRHFSTHGRSCASFVGWGGARPAGLDRIIRKPLNPPRGSGSGVFTKFRGVFGDCAVHPKPGPFVNTTPASRAG